MELIALFRERHPEVVAQVAPTEEGYVGYGEPPPAVGPQQEELERVLGYLLDESEFLGPYGIRSLSRYHQDHPFVFHLERPARKTCRYLPGGVEHGDVRR